MVFHPEVLWAQRSSESDEKKVSDLRAPIQDLVRGLIPDIHVALQNILYVTVNLPDIKPETLKYNLTSTSISFEAKAGKYVHFFSIVAVARWLRLGRAQRGEGHRGERICFQLRPL